MAIHLQNRLPAAIAATLVVVNVVHLAADDGSADAGTPGKAVPKVDKATGLLALNPAGSVLVDVKGKRVVLKSKVVLTSGVLEMLACMDQTKEHESILSVDAKAFVIHTALLSIGARQGKPVQFRPEYQAPQGQRLDIFLTWTDRDGTIHRRPAQEWIRHSVYRWQVEDMKKPADLTIPKGAELRYDEPRSELLWYGPMTDKKRDELLALSRNEQYQKAIRRFHRQAQSRAMKAHWVFAGSMFYTDEETGEKYYRAEGGDLICVANFPSATIDIAIESSAAGGALMFEAWTEKIPPAGTEVMIELIPVPDGKSVVATKRGRDAADRPKAAATSQCGAQVAP